jgi:hypothetical protein
VTADRPTPNRPNVPTPTDLPVGATLNVPCTCPTNQASCYRHGQHGAVSLAACVLRGYGASDALDVIRGAVR